MEGIKHLVDCHCVLPQYRNREIPVYHKFIVFSIVDDSNTVVPKFVQCNNCAVIHKVYDICKSEIAAGREDLRSVVTPEEIKISIPPQLWDILENYGVDITIMEHAKYIFDHDEWGESIIISKEHINQDVVGKRLIIENSQNLK